MSRKELLKRSLGITEYPWSSDDDLDGPSAPTAPDIPAAIRPYDSRTATAPDINSANRSYDHRTANNTPAPGPSGLQPWASIPRRQAKIERDLYWSILRSPCNPIRTGPQPFPLPTPNCRQLRQEDTAISGNLMHAPAADHRRSIRASNVPDVQRMLAFKRLTRNINALRQRSAVPTTIGPSHSNCIPVSSSPVIRVNSGRRHITMRRYYQPSRSFHFLHRNGNDDVQASSNANNEEPQSVQRAREATAGVAADTERRSPVSPASTPQIQVNINIHNDEEEADSTGPSISQSILGDEVNLIPDDTSDIEILDNHTSALSLEEEIVEIADAEEADPLPPPARSPATVDLEEIQANTRDPNLASTSSPAVEPSTLPSKQGVKRKRQDSDDNMEPCTVKEFNQELLRLLECPVCLEWMEPPMSQCRRGHLVCGRCRARLNSCPVCRTTFSSVRNRAMEGVAEMLRYPCRHGCGREVRLRRRSPHEASCALRKYQCPAPACGQNATMPRQMLAEHFQSKHLPMLKIGGRHNFSIKMSAEQHDNWLILAMDEYFHLRIDVDIRVFVYVAYIGPKCDAKNFTYEVTVEGQHHSRKLVYARSTHCDLESPSVNVSREDCFSLSLDQALNFIRFKNRRCDADKYLDFNVEITKMVSVKDESDS